MAFVGIAGATAHVTPKARALCEKRSVSHANRKAVIRASRDLKERTTFASIEENKRIKQDAEETGPQGFTAYSEKVNGRLAMIGFTLALVTEAIAPSHPSLIKQLFTLFPIDKLLGM
mmetsp:Transcript_7121/g.15221  ORF Transcript_7121/g.15221 Transcript_7121/m.15221 type:complete len:117 (-) Transcript_7121:86-436(-)|eukprot:CAMPEP_0185845190 /NCGR_PEP_ID=MMETSP1354-20130828/1214_1 /TAXON_ID=708628 /ORGANISM="Erythrolobus madagascarensis, Strain CCMP3276" /LENGTH=116 /DNA_ID=CAMNT_0028545085 /DNA_START=94 /DNA_END=444 /DNA_ORIENTATION=+